LRSGAQPSETKFTVIRAACHARIAAEWHAEKGPEIGTVQIRQYRTKKTAALPDGFGRPFDRRSKF
jgi:hypothetical protein